MSAKRSEKCESNQQQNGSSTFASGEGLNFPQTPPGRVLFNSEDEDSKDSRKDSSRFLTAKYQKQQMGMIRKRIAIEDWIEEELPSILKRDEDEEDDDDASLDLDEILTIQGDDQRVEYIKNKLTSLSRASDPTSIGTFTKSLIEKLQELK